jgi:hypothetical protein
MDPGKKLAGIAVFIEGTLDYAFLAKGEGPPDVALDVADKLCPRYTYPETAVFVSEYPQIYQAMRVVSGARKRVSFGDPNDLLPLAQCVGAVQIALIFRRLVWSTKHCKTYLPREWKGQVPKDIMIKRIQERLAPDERTRVEHPRAKSLSHNVWDAVGIGLRTLGRL